ncbi:hypothetical protein LOTGIDRAFT_238363 [Lottia gigantea]|uniref:Cyclin-dependent kinase inhibitor domain-containing protein n=1 Tax=Lottia gigantea TaxID=225164 RepID=V4B526_LOTGI|nr:hypothetical protein LOTGIDRAFT_238363 [Lottia gigantea]ESP01077.1 hypothetical protein LOTGIDRAFT_238363 [Lottia gigantea]
MSTNIVASSERSMKSKARRCLFGPVDHEVVRKDLDSMIKDTSADYEDWGFNMSTDKPKQGGRCEWYKVDTDLEYVPEFYRKGYTSRQPPTPRKINIPRPTNVNVKKSTVVRQLDISFKNSSNVPETSDNSSTSILPSTVPSFTFSTSNPPSTPTRTPSRSRRSRNETPSSQSRISDFMNIRKRRNDGESSSQRKLPRL